MDRILKCDAPIQIVKLANFLGVILGQKTQIKSILSCFVYGSTSATSLANLDPSYNQDPRLSLERFLEILYVETLESYKKSVEISYICNISSN